MRRLLAAAACAALAACKTSTPPRDVPPRTEFLLSSADSTFWVATNDGQVHVRGAPLNLARFGGHFYELYTADDDFSYADALLLGQRLYRRDITTGDSTVLFADTAVARIASNYARAHPDEDPIGPNDDVDADPTTTATAQVDVLGVYGPYVAYEYHLDVDLPGSRPWHATRRGVVDLRSGSQATVADLFGAANARSLTNDGRKTYEATRDSILAQRSANPTEDRRAADALLRLQFDERSFTIDNIDGKPAVEFDVPGRGQGIAGRVLELDPVPVEPTPWWRDALPSLAEEMSNGDDRWSHDRVRVVAHYDQVGDLAHISLSDTGSRQWPVATVLGPLRHVTWLDGAALSSGDRTALRHAFNTAASYDEAARVALLPSPVSRRPSIHYASLEARSRKPARNLRAHDAGTRQQHGSRVRRRGAVDDGQGRGNRGISPQPSERRHGVDRPRGLSRADSSRRSAGHESQRELRGTLVHGSRRSR